MGKHSGKGGKSGLGKALGFAGLAVGAFNPAAFGLALSTAGRVGAAIFGLSLGTTIASAFAKTGTTQTSNFDSKMNTVSADARIPLVYGTRKVGGLQSYHHCSIKNKYLIKDVIIGEGMFSGCYGLTANNYMVKTENASANVFGITNTKYSDAKARISDHRLCLYCNGEEDSIYLDKSDNLKDDQSNDFNCSMAKLYERIEGVNFDSYYSDKGWKIERPIVCDDDPYNLASRDWGSCYNTTVWFWEGKYETGDSKVTFYDGTQDAPSYYEKTGGYPHMAYLHAYLKYTEKLGSGNPTVTCVAQGRKVYDTRTGKWQYSENPAMIVRDYLINKTFGSGYFITSDMLDEDSFKEVANYCDEQITRYDGKGRTIKEPRYTLNIVLTEKQSYLDHIQQMLACFAGFLVFSNGKVSLHVEKAETPVYAFTDDNIIENSISYKALSSSDAPNRLCMKYIEPALDWASTSAIVEDLQDQEPLPIGRGKIVSKDVNLIGCTSQSQALRLGKLYRDIIRLCPVTMTFKTAMQGMHLEPGDIVTVTHNVILDSEVHELFKEMPVRIVEVRDNNGEYTLTCKQYNASIYDDALGGNLRIYSYTDLTEQYLRDSVNMDGWYEPPADVTNVKTKVSPVDGSEVTITWSPVTGNTIKGYRIYVNDELQGNVITDTTYVYHCPKTGDYTFKVVTVDIYGGESVNPKEIQMNIVCEPEEVLNFTATIDKHNRSKVNFTWDANKEINISYYEIRLGDTWDTSPTIVNKIKSLDASYTVSSTGWYRFMIKAVNANGDYSKREAIAERQITVEPPAPTDFTVVQSATDKSKARASWTNVDGDDVMQYIVKEGNSWDSGTIVGYTTNTFLDITLDESRTYTFMVKAQAVNGHYGAASICVVTCSVNPADVSNLRVAQSISNRAMVTLTWDAPDEQDVSYYVVKEGLEWEAGKLISPRVFGTIYEVAISTEGIHSWMVKAVTISGHESQYPAIVTGTFNLAPNSVESLQATQSTSDISILNINWTPVDDSDLAGYQVKVGDNWTSGDPLPFTRELYATYKLTGSTSFRIMIKAKNNACYYSDETSIMYVAKVEPDDVQGLVAFQNGNTVELYWDKVQQDDIVGYEVREGLSFDTSTETESSVNGTNYTAFIDVPRTYRYYVRAINQSGHYSRNPAKVSLAVENLLPRNVIESYDIIGEENGTHYFTEFVQSIYNFQTLGGKFSDYPTTRFQDIGGSKVIRLQYRYAWKCSADSKTLIYIPDNSAQMPTDTLTVCMCLYSDDWSKAANGTHETADGWLLQFVDGNAEFTVNTESHGQQQVTKDITSLSKGWHFFFGSFDKGNISMIIDSGSPVTLNIGEDSLVYGNATAGSSTCGRFDGMMDLLAIYNRTITSAERKAIIDTDEFEDDVVGLYYFMDNGYTLHDYSNTGNNGIILGEPLTKVNKFFKHGMYYTNQISIGKESNCNISVFFESTATMYGGLAELQVSQSLDGESWTDWSGFKPGQRTFKYIKFRVRLESYNSELNSPEVNKFVVNIDVPDKDIAISVDIAKGGTVVKYGYEFHKVPAVVPAAVGENFHAELVSKDTQECTIKIKDSSNTDVGGKADIHIRGF